MIRNRGFVKKRRQGNLNLNMEGKNHQNLFYYFQIYSYPVVSTMSYKYSFEGK